MRKLDVSVNVRPFGVTAAKFADGARIKIKARTGEELCADLTRAAAEALRDELTAALAPMAPAEDIDDGNA